MRYLTIDDVVIVHANMMRRMGEAPQPLVRPDLLGSALARPLWAAQYEGADLIVQAARLGLGIARAHAFVDGNKRTAYEVMTLFLDLNGVELRDPGLGLAKILEWAVSSEVDDDAAEARLAAELTDLVHPAT